ncbi:MAG: methyl-accepting chemotaxis protein, partial [Spirochaetota bacterium]|nr:methyl-accepting chemotaxis protein [Spirochaetota bacterium]
FSRMQKDIETLDLSVQDLSSSSNEIATTSNEQASAVREIVSTMEDSESLTKSIEKMIEKVSGISIKISEMITSGLNNVVKSQDKMAEIKVSNDDSITGIRFLSEKIEAIWEIVSIINSIADQTKIIAFNAELEASAAGEAGKNFQIVASEIRRLADSTVNSTSEIKSRIKEIQHSSDSLITSSEDGTNKIKEGGDLVTTLYRTFEEIMTTSQMSADSAKEITFSVRQMVESFEQILLTLKQISEGINNFVVTTKSTSEISQNLKGISDQMTEFLDFYKINNTEESE